MPQRRPNPIARIVAVIALLAAIMLVAVVFVMDSSESDSGGDGNDNGTLVGEPTKQGEKALERGFYIVKEGDTLAQIASNTGFELDELVELNPQLDPQALIAGDRVRLR